MNSGGPFSDQPVRQAAHQHVASEAEAWWACMQAASATQEQRDAFASWRAANPAHDLAYRQLEHVYAQAAGLRAHPQARAAALAVRQAAEQARRRRQRRRWTLPLSAAAVLLLAVAGVGWHAWDPAQPERHFLTAIGEQRRVVLEDGSVLLLDTDSELTVRYSRKHRDLWLLRGQAQFSVAHSPDQPFVVNVGQGAVRALGTQFQVRRGEEDAFRVALIEGEVMVSVPASDPAAPARSTTLEAGEQLSFAADRDWTRQRLDLDVVQGWPKGELVFERARLSEILVETNRYTDAKLRLADPALGDVRISAVFDGNDQASLIQALEHVAGLRAQQVSVHEVLLRKP